MADESKPYRVYRGGRVRGKVPSPSIGKGRTKDSQPGGPGYRGPGPARKPRSKWRYLRWVGILVVLFLLWAIAWGLAGYFSIRDGVRQANKRLPKSAARGLTKQDGILFDTSTTILLLGTDHSSHADRKGDRHSDSIMLVRTDPDRHRIFYLSIPRDLLVEIPGIGQQKINAAYQFGGAKLALQTIKTLTNIEINHLVVIDFARFKELIDAVGGIDITVKRPIYSNSFDCPFKADKCRTWKGYRFAKGPQHMNGQRALVYSRIRENRLDPSENDLTRAERQQQVVQAVLGKLASFGTFVDAPFHGDELLRPIATDMTPGQFLGLAWVKFRAGTEIHCRLGGELTGDGSALQSLEENRNVIDEFEGTSAVQPPAPVSGNVLAAGCVEGDKPIGRK